MTLETVRTVARRYLIDPKPGVLAIKGEWGVGKTYAWNHFVKEVGEECTRDKYAYVSLFGIGSIAELRSAIFAKTQAIRTIDKPFDKSKLGDHLISLRGKGAELLQNFRELGYAKYVSVSIDALMPFLLRDSIICLDDFERMNDSRVPTDQLLGFISELREERNCKVVLIFNETKLAAKEADYRKYREKVIDLELVFDPSPAEAVAIGFPVDMAHRARASELAIQLKIRNIRVLRKTADLINLLQKEAANLHPALAEQIVQTTVLFACCYYDSTRNTPTMDFLLNWNAMAFAIRREARKDAKEGELNEQHQKWAELLENYNFPHVDEVDKAIAKVIEHGYVEETGLRQALNEQNRVLQAGELRDAYSSRWRLVHDSFNDDEEELIRGLNEGFRQSVQTIAPENLDETVLLFRELGRDADADALIEYYIRARADEPQLFDLSRRAFADGIKDSEVKRRFAAHHHETVQPLGLVQAVYNMIERDGTYTAEELEVLKAATVDEIYALFKSYDGHKRHVVKPFLQFQHEQDNAAISEKARAALIRIGEENRLNAIRVRRYGVNIVPGNPNSEGAA